VLGFCISRQSNVFVQILTFGAALDLLLFPYRSRNQIEEKSIEKQSVSLSVIFEELEYFPQFMPATPSFNKLPGSYHEAI
jgi:hypothetical protein